MINALLKDYKIKTTIKDGRVLDMVLTTKQPDNISSYKVKKLSTVKLNFKDSYLLLLVSLRKAGEGSKNIKRCVSV